jgi:peptidyl-prolyl cis-trans isomerase C
MGYFKRAAGCAAILAVFLAPTQIFAQDSENKVLAKIDGVVIRQSDFDLFASLDPQFAQLQGEQKQLAILASLIDVKSLAKKAASEGFDQNEDFKVQMELLKDRTLHNAYFRKNVVDSITEEELRARFDKELASATPQSEYRARHILVKKLEEATAVIKELDGGADFAELATTTSTGPSGPKGGDLGFASAGQMVPEFEAAALALEVGAYTKEPVLTNFGFHIIKLEEKRDLPFPAFEAVKDQMQQVVFRERYLEATKQAREGLDFEIVDPSLKENYEKIEQ